MKILKPQIVILLLIAELTTTQASETYTNWNWASLGLIIPRTNLFLGEKISASVVVSNLLESEHSLWLYAGDPCLCGPGKIVITDLESGKEIECKFSRDGRAGWANYYNILLQGHKSKTSETDLTKGYAITNAGVYSMQAVGWFPLNEPPTNNQYATVETPPIFVWISPKVETNSPPK